MQAFLFLLSYPMGCLRLAIYCFLLLPLMFFFSVSQAQQRQLPYEEQLILDAPYTGRSFTEAMHEIGRKHGFRVFHVDSADVTIEGNFQAAPLGQLLRSVSSSSSLRYFWFDAHNLLFFSGDRLEEVLQSNYLESIARRSSPGVEGGQAAAPASLQPAGNDNIKYTQANRDRKRDITISGKVVNAADGESLYGATVYFEELAKGVAADFDGNFQLRMPPGVYNITVSAVGFDSEEDRVFLPYDGSVEIRLFEKSIRMKEIMVVASAREEQVKSIASGQEKLDIKTIEKMPAFMGEVDVIRSISMLPGISTTGEGSAGFQVRGGGVDQNLVLLDGIPIFQTSHLFGFFSAFHPDLVQGVTVHKGSMPAEYGGRVSSVLDVRTRSGNTERIQAQGGLGLVSSRLAIDGPLLNRKTTFAIGGRASYSDWILKELKDLSVRNSRASFYDGQANIRHRFSDKDQLTFSSYLSADSFKFASDTTYEYQSRGASLQWNHLFPKHTLLDVNTFYSEYNSIISGGGVSHGFSLASDVHLYGLQANLSLPAGKKHQWKTGISSILYQLAPGFMEPVGKFSAIEQKQMQEESGIESAIYIADRIELSPRLAIEAGLRYSLYHALGPYDVYNYAPGVPQSKEVITDTLGFAAGQVIARYGGLEPRFSMRYMLDFYQSVKFSYNRSRQYIHLISNTSSITPVDVWKLSNQYIQPQWGDQLSVGYFRNSKEGRYEFSTELYYKWLHQLIEYKDRAVLLLNPALEADLMTARGKAYGVETMVEKKEGRLTGWLSYTYSRSLRQTLSEWSSEQLNNGAYYPANFDKPHDLTTIVNYQMSRRWRASANFTYSTGRPTTYAEGRYLFDGVVIPDYSERNNYRIPDYHRLDLSLTYGKSLKVNQRWSGSWTLSVYNVYARKNAYSVYFKNVGKYGPPGAYQLSILGTALPAITYNFHFK